MNERVFIALVETLPKDRLAEPAGGIVNHPIWTVGHLANAGDMLRGILGHERVTSREYVTLFDTGSTPVHNSSIYPSLHQLVSDYQRVHQSVCEMIRDLSDTEITKLVEIEEAKPKFPTHGHLLSHIVSWHEGVHYGQLVQWRAAADC
ncbi:DinB family protein [Poriferisphaera corsica]|uniref:DinB family protein n=1 Tax=Poriferisphaera corsica TaxID=2528020 RepID=UPI0019098274|nr:DinB family protein [Poriferisphaera corsica]